MAKLKCFSLENINKIKIDSFLCTLKKNQHFNSTKNFELLFKKGAEL